MGSVGFFFNFWRIFESPNLALFMGFLRFGWEILHIMHWIGLILQYIIERGYSKLHTKNGVCQILFQFLKIVIFQYFAKIRCFHGKFCTSLNGSASNLAQWYIWIVVTWTSIIKFVRFFFNFLWFFENANLAHFMGFLRFTWEILLESCTKLGLN